MWSRRSFLRGAAGVIHVAAAMVLGVPVVRFLLAPIRRRRGASEFVSAIPVTSMPTDRPARVALAGEVRDAFVVHAAVPMGSVFLVPKGVIAGAADVGDPPQSPLGKGGGEEVARDVAADGSKEAARGVGAAGGVGVAGGAGEGPRVGLVGGGEDVAGGVRCLHTVCPHLGCAIEFSAEKGVFECPCHASAFDLRGNVLAGPSPRPMDELECRIGEADSSGTRWIEVRYERFRCGVQERVPL